MDTKRLPAISRRRRAEIAVPSLIPFGLAIKDFYDLAQGLPGVIGLPWWGWLLIGLVWLLCVFLFPTQESSESAIETTARGDSVANTVVGSGNTVTSQVENKNS
jgi:uncharacterized membrane protein